MKDAPYDMLNVVLNSGKVVVQFRNQGNLMYPHEAKSTYAIDDDTWHHFVVMRGFDGEIYLFVDGAFHEKAQGRTVLQPQAGKFITNNRVIGAEAMLLTGNRHPLYDHSRYQGAIDDLCFFGAVLNEAQIRQLSKRE